jgi:hypothetical protein
VSVAEVQAHLLAAGAPFGAAAPRPPVLRWGLLFAALDGAWDEDYVRAVELIYEGYLYHYREERVTAPACARETALLAGDVFYARGLRLIAARGDAAAVGLLARLMAACSYLRSLAAPFAADDALWAATMAGLAALRRGTDAFTAGELFDWVETGLADGAALDVAALAREAAPALALPDPAPLAEALAALDGRALVPAVALGPTSTDWE